MTDERASPVCYGAEADDAYMGYIPRDELLQALNELLEAERAGARVALASAKTFSASDFANLMEQVRADEAHWCAMLSRQIRRLGGSPSQRTGTFYKKAMAIADPAQRTSFLNRGQSWVVRRLETLIPRVRDEGLHADLRDMEKRHRENIDLAAAFLAGSRAQPGDR